MGSSRGVSKTRGTNDTRKANRLLNGEEDSLENGTGYGDQTAHPRIQHFLWLAWLGAVLTLSLLSLKGMRAEFSARMAKEYPLEDLDAVNLMDAPVDLIPTSLEDVRGVYLPPPVNQDIIMYIASACMGCVSANAYVV